MWITNSRRTASLALLKRFFSDRDTVYEHNPRALLAFHMLYSFNSWLSVKHDRGGRFGYSVFTVIVSYASVSQTGEQSTHLGNGSVSISSTYTPSKEVKFSKVS